MEEACFEKGWRVEWEAIEFEANCNLFILKMNTLESQPFRKERLRPMQIEGFGSNSGQRSNGCSTIWVVFGCLGVTVVVLLLVSFSMSFGEEKKNEETEQSPEEKWNNDNDLFPSSSSDFGFSSSDWMNSGNGDELGQGSSEYGLSSSSEDFWENYENGGFDQSAEKGEGKEQSSEGGEEEEEEEATEEEEEEATEEETEEEESKQSASDKNNENENSKEQNKEDGKDTKLPSSPTPTSIIPSFNKTFNQLKTEQLANYKQDELHPLSYISSKTFTQEQQYSDYSPGNQKTDQQKRKVSISDLKSLSNSSIFTLNPLSSKVPIKPSLYYSNETKKSISFNSPVIYNVTQNADFCQNSSTFTLPGQSTHSNDSKLSSFLQRDLKQLERNTSEEVVMELQLIKRDEFSIVIRNKTQEKDQAEFHLPGSDPFVFDKEREANLTLEETEYDVVLPQKGEELGFVVIRKSTKEILIDSRAMGIGYFDQYRTIQLRIPKQNIFGLGERFTNFSLASGTYTVWPKASNGQIDFGLGDGSQSYGCQPLIMMMDNHSKPLLILFRNTGPLEFNITEDDSSKYIRVHSVSGRLELRVWMGEDLEQTVREYHRYLGGYAIPPFWSMGNHHSRQGWEDVEALESVVEGFDNRSIPIEAIWNDLDYMKERQTFTFNSKDFKPEEFKTFIEDKKVRWVPVLSAGVSLAGPIGVVEEGNNWDVWQKGCENQTIVGEIWSDSVSFPDFTNEKAEQLWQDGLENLYNKVPFSGVSLNRNELTGLNGLNGNCSNSKQLPFEPPGTFDQMAIDPRAMMQNGELQLDYHSLFNLFQGQASYSFLKNHTKFPFVLSRANVFGGGKFYAHWSGDNVANYTFLEISIGSVFSFNLFGIPMSGDDICGFGNRTNQALCARWYQVGSLYPFSRNNNNPQGGNQEPWELGVVVKNSAKRNILQKYSILKYYHSLFLLNVGNYSLENGCKLEFGMSRMGQEWFIAHCFSSGKMIRMF